MKQSNVINYFLFHDFVVSIELKFKIISYSVIFAVEKILNFKRN